MRYCANPGCDAGFVWVSDRWARHEAGVGQHDTAADVDEKAWRVYLARLNTVTVCTTCNGRGTATLADRADRQPPNEGAA